jgi:site-specific DNA recombinase
VDKATDENYQLKELKQNAQVQNAEYQGKRQHIEEMSESLNEQTGELIEYEILSYKQQI